MYVYFVRWLQVVWHALLLMFVCWTVIVYALGAYAGSRMYKLEQNRKWLNALLVKSLES